MKTYKYLDYMDDRKVIFTCEAETILDADKKLFEVTGIKAEKNLNIGCTSDEIINNDGPKMR